MKLNVRTIQLMILASMTVLLCLNPSRADTMNNGATVISFGAATQGNGHNVPSTQGWYWAEIQTTLMEARLLQEKEEKPVYIDFSSLVGSSSGSFFVLLMDALLKNENLVDIKSKPEGLESVLTLEEAERVANGLRFIMLGTDYSWVKKLRTEFHALVNISGQFIEKLSAKLQFHPSWLFGEHPELWMGIINPDTAIADFGRLVHAAQILNRDALEKKLKDMPEFKKFVKQNYKDVNDLQTLSELTYLTDVVTVPEESSDKTQLSNLEDFKELKAFSQWQKKMVRKEIDHLVRSDVGILTDFMRHYFGGMTPPDISTGVSVDESADGTDTSLDSKARHKNNFKKTMATKLGDGMITGSIGIPYPSMDDLMTKVKSVADLDYNQFRFYLFMDEATANVLLQSKEYQEQVTTNPWLKRYVIAVVDQRWAALRMSIQEPELENESSAKMSSYQYRIRSYYDPHEDIDRNFQLVSTASTENKNKSILMLGGFFYDSMSAWVSSIYQKERVNQLRKYFKTVIPRFALYGLPNTPEEQTFSISKIKNLFSHNNQEEANKNADDWNQFARNALENATNTVRKLGGVFFLTKLDWDLYKKGKSKPLSPAMISGNGQVIFSRVANRVFDTHFEFLKTMYGDFFKNENLSKPVRTDGRRFFDPKPELEDHFPPFPPLKSQFSSCNDHYNL